MEYIIHPGHPANDITAYYTEEHGTAYISKNIHTNITLIFLNKLNLFLVPLGKISTWFKIWFFTHPIHPSRSKNVQPRSTNLITITLRCSRRADYVTMATMLVSKQQFQFHCQPNWQYRGGPTQLSPILTMYKLPLFTYKLAWINYHILPGTNHWWWELAQNILMLILVIYPTYKGDIALRQRIFESLSVVWSSTQGFWWPMLRNCVRSGSVTLDRTFCMRRLIRSSIHMLLMVPYALLSSLSDVWCRVHCSFSSSSCGRNRQHVRQNNPHAKLFLPLPALSLFICTA